MSITITGITDSPALSCSGFTNQTITVTVSTGSPSDVTTGTTTFANPSFIAGATVSNTVGSPGNIAAAAVTTDVGSCTEPGGGCGFNRYDCTNGSQATSTQNREQQTNCAGNGIGVFVNVGGAVAGSRTCVSSNSAYVVPSGTPGTCSLTGGGTDVVARFTITPGSGYSTWSVQLTGTCDDSSTVTRGCSSGSGSCSPLPFCSGSFLTSMNASFSILTTGSLGNVNVNVGSTTCS